MRPYLSFRIGDEDYALELGQAREVIAYPEITVVPRQPPSIRGMVHLRGSMVPVVDLGIVFGLPSRPVTKWTCVVVATSSDGRWIGIVVDRVRDVIELTPEEIVPPPAFGTSGPPRLLRGVSNHAGTIVRILELEAVVNDLTRARAAPAAVEAS